MATARTYIYTEFLEIYKFLKIYPYGDNIISNFYFVKLNVGSDIVGSIIFSFPPDFGITIFNLIAFLVLTVLSIRTIAKRKKWEIRLVYWITIVTFASIVFCIVLLLMFS